MKPFIFTYFLAGFACLIYAQKAPQNSNKVDKNNLRQGNWTILYDEHWNTVKDTNKATYYRLLSYKDGVTIGIVKDYYLSGIIQWKGWFLMKVFLIIGQLMY